MFFLFRFIGRLIIPGKFRDWILKDERELRREAEDMLWMIKYIKEELNKLNCR